VLHCYEIPTEIRTYRKQKGKKRKKRIEMQIRQLMENPRLGSEVKVPG